MKKQLIVMVMPVLFLLGSCRDAVHLNRPEDYFDITTFNNEESWESVFQSYWDGMNNNYLFWDIDPTDWDGVYREYNPKFAVLDIKDKADTDTAFAYFLAVTANLIDGHYSLEVSDLYGREMMFIPSSVRLFREYDDDYYEYLETYKYKTDRDAAFNKLSQELQESDYYAERDGEWPHSDMMRLAVQNYLESGSYNYAAISANDDFPVLDGFVIVTGMIKNGKILYFHISNFDIYDIDRAYKARQEEGVYDEMAGKREDEILDDPRYRFANEIRQVEGALEQFYEKLKDPDLEGVIIDMRGNTGGYNFDLSTLWGRMITVEHTFFYAKSKMGDNRLDYTPRMPVKTFPAPGGVAIGVPVVGIINRKTMSCGELTAMFINSLPNGRLVGGTTSGAQGGLTDNPRMNGGQFTAPRLKMVYTPSVQTYYLDGKSYEGKGFPPDIFVPFDFTKLRAGTDTRLEAAIQFVNDNR
jgi:hypothetical protein